MSALWGKPIIRVAAVLPALCLLAGGISSCEYNTDADVPRDAASGPPSNASPDNRVTPPSPQDPQDNIDALAEVLGPPDGSGLPYASGGAASWTEEVPTGEYFLTAACVAAPGAELVVRVGNAEPERTSFRCGMGKVIYLDHKGGRISAEVVPPADSPYVFTGVKLDPDQAPRDPSAAETTAWAAGELGPEQAGEFRGYPWDGKWHHSGPVDVPGMLTFTFVCEGPATVDVTVLRPRGEDLFQGSGLPCGRPVPADIQVGPEGVMVMVDSNNYPVQAAYSLLPAAGSGQ
ncbi:hypothetical protein [Arthrobacter sp. Y81]|uniref:hypothetical protein n=1 Tax=Arthrobacter sp. Y81 TaxID=2058897 RepID=UPI0011B0DA41|nr:hypothetical protein [Arthrobacter sp. Y81]